MKTKKKHVNINHILSAVIALLFVISTALFVFAATGSGESTTWTPNGGQTDRKLQVWVTTTGSNVDDKSYKVTVKGEMGVWKNNLTTTINGDVFINGSSGTSHTHSATKTKKYTYSDSGTNQTSKANVISKGITISSSSSFTKGHTAVTKYGHAHCQKPKTTNTPLRNAYAVASVSVPAHKQYTVTYNANTVDTSGNSLVGTPKNIPAAAVNCISAVDCSSSEDWIQCVDEGFPHTLTSPSLDGYKFQGWNTAKDGSGTSYKAGDDAPDANITLYAQWKLMPKKTMFDTGENVNVKLKSLASTETTGSVSTDDTTIKYIKRASAKTSSGNTVNLAPDNTGTEEYTEIPAWISGDTIYYYCSEDEIEMNENSNYMFAWMKSLESVDMTGWDSSNVKYMVSMFYYCTSLPSIDLSSWDISKLESMDSIFHSCSKMETVTLPRGNTNLKWMQYMFYYCGSLKTVDLSGMKFNNAVEEVNDMFYGCASLEEMNISSLDMTNSSGDFTDFYKGMGKLKTIVLGRKNRLTAAKFPPTGWWQNEDTKKKYDAASLMKAFDNAPSSMEGTYHKLSYSFAKKDDSDGTVNKVDIKKIQPSNGAASIETNLGNREKITILNLPGSTKYKVTEKDSGKYIPEFSTTADKASVKNRKATSSQALGTPIENIGPNAVYTFRNYLSSQPKGNELIIRKKLAGDKISDSDKEKSFEFEYRLSGLDPSVNYTAYLPGTSDDAESEDYNSSLVKSISPSSNGTYTGKFTMKASGDNINDTFRIRGLPMGAKFDVREVQLQDVVGDLTESMKDDLYASKYEVTMGSDLTKMDGDSGVKKLGNISDFSAFTNEASVDESDTHDFGLSTPVEEFGAEEQCIEYTFTNSKAAYHSLELEKSVIQSGQEVKDNDEEYTFELVGTDLEPNHTYTSEDGSVSFETDNIGNIKTSILGDLLLENDNAVKIKLKAGQTLKFNNIPGTAKLKLMENGSSYIPEFKLLDASGKEAASKDGKQDKNTTFDIGDTVIDQDYKIHVDNIREDKHFLKISKELDGDGANKKDTFTAHITLKNLEPHTSYACIGTGGPDKFTADADGTYTLDLTLSSDSTFQIQNLPDGAVFKITEDKNEKGYAPSYVVETQGSGIKTLNTAGELGESLESPWETLTADATYTFTNTRDIENPKKTVSDTDNVTKDGIGKESNVTENTVENKSSTWTYKITQDVLPGTESFSIRDILPPYLETILSEEEDLNMVNVRFIKNDGSKVQGNMVEVTSSDSEDEEISSYKNDAFNITYDSSDVNGIVKAELADKELLKEGGTVELEVMVYLPEDTSMDDLDDAGCLDKADQKLVFVNQGETTVNGNDYDTNETRTNIPIDTGLTIRKNVVGELGDKNKDFKFTIKLSGLLSNTEYTMNNPEKVTVNASYNDKTNTLTFKALSDDGGQSKKDIKIKIYEDTGDDDGDLVGTVTTDKSGAASIELDSGNYIASCGGKKQAFSIEPDATEEGVESNKLRGFEKIVFTSEGDVTKFTSDDNGKATVGFTLRHGKTVSFTDLPAGTVYEVTESKEGLYIADYLVQKGSDTVKTSSKKNTKANQDLSTGENELVSEKPVTIQFNNTTLTADITIDKVTSSGKLLPGAKLSLYDYAGRKIASWTSDTSGKRVTVAVGRDYTLKEDEAPSGYQKANNATFVVLASSGKLYDWIEDVTLSDNTYKMIDKPVERTVKIEKKDFTTKALLEGADLVLTNKAGDVIKKWTSTNAAESISIPVGEYILKEENAPDGYQKAKQIAFAVDEDGNITSNTPEYINGGTISMYDKKEGKSILIKKEVHGALGDTDKSFNFHLKIKNLPAKEQVKFYNESGVFEYIADENGEISIDFGLKNGESVNTSDLPIGATYQVTEDGDDYHKASYEITSDKDTAIIKSASGKNDRMGEALSTEEEQADKEDGNGTTITFINTRDIASVTGVPGSGMILAIVSGLALAAAGIILRRKMRHKHKEVE